MTNFNKNCLEAQIQENINNIEKSCDVQDIAKTGFAASCVSNDRKFSVATGNDLPDLFLASDIPNGTIVFVEQIGVPVVKSNLKWLGLDGRLYRDDTNILELYGWGSNGDGDLGDGSTSCRSSPVQEVSSSINWCQVSGGESNSFAVKSFGTLWAWGDNFYGQIGDGTTSSKCSPTQEVSSSTNWCQVSGSNHSLALKNSGTLWGWGYNFYGQIGDGTTICRSSPVQEVSSSTNWCQVSGGRFHSLALKTSGTLWGWGRNNNGQIGDGTTICRSSPVQEVSSSSDWCQVSGGGFHSLALKTSGTLWAWGNNYNGQVGDGTNIIRSSPVQEVSSSTNWCQVSGGGNRSTGLKNSGTLWAWGSNFYGEIGDGTTICRSSPVQEVTSSTNWCLVSGGGIHSLALKTSGTLWGWGSNTYGALGDGTLTRRSSPVQEVSSSTNWCLVSGGGNNHSLALKHV